MQLARGHLWLLAAATVSMLGALTIARDAIALMVSLDWTTDGPGLFGWFALLLSLVLAGSSLFTALRYRLPWAVLLGSTALIGLGGVLVLLGRQPIGLVILVAAAAVGFALMRGRSALV